MPSSPPPEELSRLSEIQRLAALLARDPQSKVFLPLAEEYVKAGMWQEAAAVLEAGLQVYPGFITAMVALGRAYNHLGQTAKARALLEEAVRISPDNLTAHRTLAKIYAAEGAKESALRSCSVILAVNPQDEETLALKSVLDEHPPDEPVETETCPHTGDRLEGSLASEEQGDVQSGVPGPAVDASTSTDHQTPGKLARLEHLLRTIQLRRQS
jgi:tetratricopeptide (TPR) repeat protein